MMMWKPQAEYLCRAVAPHDLAGVPCYFVGVEEIEQYEPRLRGGCCVAWTGPLADLLLCDHLTKAGQWRGRGFGCVVDTRLVANVSELLGVVCHELAHFLTRRSPVDLPGDIELGMELLKVAPAEWASTRPAVQSRELPPWDKHGAAFVRAAVHVAARAGKVFEAVRPSMVRFATPYHGITCNENDFTNTLRTELDSTLPIRELLATDPPKLFQTRWDYATGWWDAKPVNEDYA